MFNNFFSSHGHRKGADEGVIQRAYLYLLGAAGGGWPLARPSCPPPLPQRLQTHPTRTFAREWREGAKSKVAWLLSQNRPKHSTVYKLDHTARLGTFLDTSGHRP